MLQLHQLKDTTTNMAGHMTTPETAIPKVSYDFPDTRRMHYPSHRNADDIKPVMSSECYFLKLPAEIRALVYEHLPSTWEPRPLDSDADLDIFRVSIYNATKKPLPYELDCGILGWVYTERSFDSAILLTCRNIYREAQPILYRTLEVHARFKEPEFLEQTIHTLIDSPFRYVRAFEFSISIRSLSGLPIVSFTWLRKVLEDMPYLERVGDITIPILSSVEISSSQEADAVANLIELNNSSKPICRVFIRGPRKNKVRLFDELSIHSIPVTMIPRIRRSARTRGLAARTKAYGSKVTPERIAKLGI